MNLSKSASPNCTEGVTVLIDGKRYPNPHSSSILWMREDYGV
jgi:hypothetical protein